MFDVKFKKLLQKINPKIIFEFGSFDGKDSVKYKTWLPKSDIYSFEPNPFVFENLKNTLDKLGIKSFPLAFGNQTTECSFTYTQAKVNDSYGSGGTLMFPTDECKNNNPGLWFRDRAAYVKVTTISTFCKENNISNIDFMHIDVEGYVREVLEGMGDIKPIIIYAETIGMDRNFIGAPSSQELDNLFNQMGYEKLFVNEGEGAVVYIRKDYIQKLISPANGEILNAFNAVQMKTVELSDAIKNLNDKIGTVDEFFKFKLLE